MEISREISIKTEEETKEFGKTLSESLMPGDVIALIGDLGTGKTTLTKYIAEGLGVIENVNSPTFVIVKSYDGRLPLHHFDVYRLNEEESDMESALYSIGFDEYVYGDGVSVIEWADLIYDFLPEDTKYIFIEKGEKENERIYRCTF